jgi:hypothetical protein
MKKWATQNRGYFIGAVLGALAGFLYWKYIGCLNGSCAISSHPLNSTVYFAFMGMVLMGGFKKQRSKADPGNE